ncbi:error-prone DNA polymerase [Maritalea mediterranea]|uniref:Error-prone DNA polymerase n=1 Tax=Maritalea mediterranea TaxID=2909667 RepID=A0ABS9E2S5_9HYPH|nr:error-prone DNA polymerase [Maritalea mediterranea]MCF4097151.1 error-prone DNA polymerase [Maritalea mediterranea]
MSAYAELQVTSNFSFLRGGSHPNELVASSYMRGHSAIAITDRNSFAGIVRAFREAKHIRKADENTPFRLIVGVRLDLEDGYSLLAYPTDREAFGRLCTLLSLGKMRAEKGECHLDFDDVKDHCRGSIFALIPPAKFEKAEITHLAQMAKALPKPVYLVASAAYRGDDRAHIARLNNLATQLGAQLLASNNVLYHEPERRDLQDVLTCIREKTTIERAGFLLSANAERHLKRPEEMAQLFKGYEHALTATLDIAARCQFELSDLKYEYPDETVPAGKTPQDYLAEETWAGAKWRYPNGVPDKIKINIENELKLIAQKQYAPYFLTVYDIVKYARTPQPDKGRFDEILCQGRGSAANSTVCYCLGITSVDPNEIDLLFERFITENRNEPPDIDVDFEHERREEVIQYIYERFGRHRAGLTATVITYRSRSAIREVGKAMGLTEDVTGVMASTIWGSWGSAGDKNLSESGLDFSDPYLTKVVELTRELIGFPRHLSQHVGGFVLTQRPLIETVPIGNAAMDDRTFIEWDKDDIEVLGILKVDVLALGMLTCIRKAFDLLRAHYDIDHNLASIPQDDQLVYDMICRADTLGTFQVESRAQMSMLPRLKPRIFYDLVIEVAIVRPGPIQGDMVHPYLRRRKGLEPVEMPSPAPEHGPPDELKRILQKTMGVPLFQEQAMRIAMEAAKFRPSELDELRHAMATFRRSGTIHTLEERMVERMVKRGYSRDFAQRCFNQIKGFSEYGFPESHSASFSLLVYVSCWLKHHHPEIFATALLNAQPMGFYAPAQIVRDAKEHNVEILPADINHSAWDYTLEPVEEVGDPPPAPAPVAPEHWGKSINQHSKLWAQLYPKRKWAIRVGLRQIDGFHQSYAEQIVAARQQQPFTSMEDLYHRAGLRRFDVERLADADAMRSIGLDRRQAKWAARALTPAKPLPLFDHANASEQGEKQATQLPALRPSEHVFADYQFTRFSLKAHPISFLREELQQRRLHTAQDIRKLAHNRWASMAGVVLVRQRPGTAKGVVFMTLEDETGVTNVVVWKKLLEKYRKVVMGAKLIEVHGQIQTEDNVMHLIARKLVDRTNWLEKLSDGFVRPAYAPADEVVSNVEYDSRVKPDTARHPRNVRVIPRSRDFH